MGAVRLKDVAERAGVHPATVSRALNPETEAVVSAATVRRVRKVAEELGYQPNPLARGLRTSRSMSIGLVIPDIANPLFPSIVRGVEDAIAEDGYSVLMANTDNDPERQRHVVRVLRARQIDACIFATAERSDPFLQEVIDSGLHVVLANRTVAGARSVVADDAHGIALALDHLIGLGHRHIAHLAGPARTSTGHARRLAFDHGVQRHELEPARCPVIECDGFTEQGGRAAAERLLNESTISAVVCGNDLIALGLYDVLADRGLSCPVDVSVVGFNDLRFVDRLDPPLTTVRVPQYELGAEAGRLTMEMIRDPEAGGRTVVLPVELVVRLSATSP